MNESRVTAHASPRRCLALAALALLLGACAPDAEERINQLVPVAAEVHELQRQVVADPLADEAFEHEFAARLRMRAIECSRGQPVAWWTSDADLKATLAPQRDCFAAVDAALLQWLERRRIGFLLAQSPLFPPPPQAGPVLAGRSTAAGAVRHAAFANAAGVAAIAQEREVATFDTNTGNVIGWMDHAGAGPLSVSPNGRVVAIAVDGAVRLHEVDGSEFGVVAQAAQGRTWWLSDTVLAWNDAHDDTLNVIDFQHARHTRVPELTGVHGVVPVRDAPGRVFALAREGAALLIVPPEGSPYQPTVSIAPLPGMSVLEGDRAITPEGHVFGVAAGGVLQATRDGNAHHAMRLQGTMRQIELGSLPLQGLLPSGDPDRLLLALPGKVGPLWYAYTLSKRELAALSPPLAVDARLDYVPALRRNVMIDGNGVRVLERIGLANAEPLAVLEKRHAGHLATFVLADVEPAAPKPAAPPPKAAPPPEPPKGPYAMINGREVPTAPVEAPAGPYAVINGRVIEVPTTKAPARTTPPPTPGPPKKGREALVEGLRSGVLRLATEADLNEWRRSYERHARHGVPREFNERIEHNTKYVITGDYTIPDDLTGSASAVFILQSGAPFPNGEASHSPILDINSGACVGWVCRSLASDD
jgi:hypothetical protein